MSESNEKTARPTLTLSKLGLSKNVDAGKVKQNFQPGRSRSVKVEVRKKRSFTRDENGKIVEVKPSQAPAPEPKALKTGKPKAEERILTDEERQSRLRALQTAAEIDAKRQTEDEIRKAREDEQRKAREEERERLAQTTIPSEEFPEKERAAARKVMPKEKSAQDLEDEEAENKRKKMKAAREGKRGKDDWLEDLNEDLNADLSKVVNEENWLSSTIKESLQQEGEDHGDTIAVEDEYEDYSEDIEEEEGDGTLVPQAVASKPSDLVKQVKGNERVVLAVPDPEKLKRYTRSEAGTGKSKRLIREELRKAQMAPSPAKPREETQQNSGGGRGRGRRRQQVKYSVPGELIAREVVVPETIEVQELANRMAVRAVDVVKELMKLGVMVTQNQTIDADTAELVVTEFGHSIKRVSDADVEQVLDDVKDAEDNLQPRPPVVTVMGHVDHGKTSLLDALRKTDVVAGEAGGITQHIGAYQVQMPGGQRITFLDTPGHAAFTQMRSRGAKMTDIVVLVVAADDGIMEQTREAISHSKAAGVPIIVAVNKIDKPDADPQKVKGELFNYELVPEEFGGDTMVVEVSAKAGTNLDKLEETILLQAEMLDLKANPNREARGAVVESKVDKGRGVVATVLVQKGTIALGDIVVAGKAMGRVRAINNDKGQSLEEAGPSMPVEILGLDEAPEAGEIVAAVESEKIARDIVEYRKQLERTRLSAASTKMSMERLLAGSSDIQKKLIVIVKGDVHGSVEAINTSLEKFTSDEVKVQVVHSGVGAITESDVTLAQASKAIIVGFNVRANAAAKKLADQEGVDIRYYSVIYNMIDDVKAALSGLLSPVMKENFIGYAEIRQVFSVTKVGKVAGCMVTDGLVKRGAKVRLLRDNVVIHEGKLKTLKRFKDEVKEVKQGFECGMAFENYDDIREGDMIEAFEVEEVARTIE